METLENVTPPDAPAGFEVWTVLDPFHDYSYLEQPGFEERFQEYKDGLFTLFGVVARTRCDCCGAWRYSPGLWGVESDSPLDDVHDIGHEEIAELQRSTER